MTLDDLMKTYDDAYEARARLEFPTPEMKKTMHRAGVWAVVNTMRTELWKLDWDDGEAMIDALDDILGHEGAP